jgi:hypothetical protein
LVPAKCFARSEGCTTRPSVSFFDNIDETLPARVLKVVGPARDDGFPNTGFIGARLGSATKVLLVGDDMGDPPTVEKRVFECHEGGVAEHDFDDEDDDQEGEEEEENDDDTRDVEITPVYRLLAVLDVSPPGDDLS